MQKIVAVLAALDDQKRFRASAWQTFVGRVLCLHIEGLTRPVIAERLGCSTTRVTRALRSSGVA